LSDSPDDRLQAHEQEQRGGRNGGRVGDAHADGVHQVFLHVGGVGVERQGAAHGQADHGHQLFGVAQQGAHRAFLGLFLLGERLGFFHAATQVQRDDRAQCADGERIRQPQAYSCSVVSRLCSTINTPGR
jgi:hypothetical protein